MNKHWEALSNPPDEALKKITGGRLQGMTDINPQWRYKAMTDVYGECGVGWKWEIVKLWTEPGVDGEVFAMAHVFVQTNTGLMDDEGYTRWSAPIPGIGGSMLIANERNGAHGNDDAFKMAVTDALSVALKFLGVGSVVYEGQLDGKYASGGQQPTSGWTPPTPKVGEVYVMSVTPKEGISKKNNRPYTVYNVEFSDFRKATTFDANLGASAQLALDGKYPVEAKMEKGQYGYTLKELQPAPKQETLADGTLVTVVNSDDDLPF